MGQVWRMGSKMKNIPSSIYKYFNNVGFRDRFINAGEVYFNSLSYFLSCEDKSRRDNTENANLYKPANGLQITKLHSQQTFTDARTLISTIKNPNRVFVYCTSNELSEVLFKRFSATTCVEIFNLPEFQKRLQKSLKNRARLGIIKNTTLLNGSVDYYNSENEPDTSHAWPDQIIMAKQSNPFSVEKEYRFAFAKDKNAFDVNNVDYSLGAEVQPFMGQHTHQVLHLGNLSDICKVVL